MTNLFFIGCSFTAGDDLDHPESQAWPALVSKSKNLTFENHAISGGTNERSVYHTIKNSDRFDHYYIAWTFITRFTRYRKDNNFEINFNHQLCNGLYEKNLEFSAYGKIHYQYWYNELFAFKTWLQQIILLQCFFKEKNLSYTMINSADNNLARWSSCWELFNDNVKSLLCFDQMNNEQLFSEHKEIQKLIDNIDKKNFIGWGEWSIQKNIAWHFPRGKTNHPLTEGHQAIADYILTYDTH
jgi:hypothetical protein